MCLRNGEVQNDLYLRIVQELAHGQRRDPERVCPCPGVQHVSVGNSGYLNAGERRDVL
jgi:hypothetical protein